MLLQRVSFLCRSNVLRQISAVSTAAVIKPIVLYSAPHRRFTTSTQRYTKMASLLTGNSFDPDNDVPNLAGKVYLITGGSRGIGLGTLAHVLQHNPAKILLLSAHEDSKEDAINNLKENEWGDVNKIEWYQCDLEDLKALDKTVQQITKEQDRLDVIVANAGIGVGKYHLSKDGIDAHTQVNVLSQMHMILTLLPLLQKTQNQYNVPTRIVMQSSDLHRVLPDSKVDFASLDELNQDIGPSYLYNRSKLAQVLFIRALEKRRAAGNLGTGLDRCYINATHPGGVSTDQQAQAEDAYSAWATVATKLLRPLLKDPWKDGCRPILWASTSEDVIYDNVRGSYIVPDKKVTDPSSTAQDEELGERFWSLAMKLLKDKVGASYSFEGFSK